MSRVQVEYQGDRIRPQVVPVQQVQAAQARFDPNDSTAFQLARALGAIDDRSLGASAARAMQASQDEERQRALAYANSMTVEELGKKVRSGELLPSKSPVFAATLQHVYGENAQSTFERDTLSRIQTGQLKFQNPEDLEKYIVGGRNGALEGQSQYTIAGYDKGFSTFRERAIAANTNLTNQQAVEKGIEVASDNLGNMLLHVTSPGFKGDPAQTLVDRYQLLRKSSLLRDDAAKEALNGLLTSVAASGRTELAQALLDKNLDNGVSVRAVVGDIRAETILKSSEAEFDKGQRQRVDVDIRPFLEQADRGELDTKKFDEFAAANEKYVTTQTLHAITSANRAAQERALRGLQQQQMLAAAEKSQAEANQLVGAAIRSGNLAFLPQQKVVTPTGEVKDFNTKEAAQRILTEDVQRMQMPLGKATEYWATNNVENPEWQKEIQAGASNIQSVGWSYDGKNVGQLNEQGQRAIETFMRINATHPAYAEKLVGNGKDYKSLSDIQFLVEKGGFPNVSDAAALVNQVNRADIKQSDFGTMTKQVASAVNDVVNPGWFSGSVQWWNGLWGNDQVNLTSVQADIRRRAELLVMSGQVPNAQAAVKASVEYLANPAVTSKINNTLYFNKDLPAVPKGEEPGKWMERFIEEVPGKTAKDQKMSSAVRLEPNQYGGFTAWVGGTPLVNQDNQVVTFRKEEISQWIDGAYRADQAKAMADRNYLLWRDKEHKRIMKEAQKMGVTPFAPGLDGASPVLTRDNYERLLREGKIK